MKKPLIIIIFMLLFVSAMSYGQSKAGTTKPSTTTKKPTTTTKNVVQPYGFTQGNHYLGPLIGYGFSLESLVLGVNYEYALDKNFGLGGVFRYQSHSETFPYVGTYSYTYMFFGVQGNYHFTSLINDTKWDPFVGLVLGYNYVKASWESSYWSSSPYSASATSDPFLSVHATMRYWFNPNISILARLDFGNIESSIGLGVDFKF